MLCSQISSDRPDCNQQTMGTEMTHDQLLNRTLSVRRDGIYEEPMGDRIILFDSATRESVSLEGSAAFVWTRCDGNTSVAEIVADFEREQPQRQGAVDVFRALDVLADKGLLLEDFPNPASPMSYSRRGLLNYGAKAAALALALVGVGSFVGTARALADDRDEPRGHGYGHDKGRGKGHDKGRGKGHDKGRGKGHHRDDDDEVATPVDCAGTWSDWDTCSCDNRTQSRTFTVTTPAANGGATCPTEPETRSCDPGECLPVNCVFTLSSTQCPVTCGTGEQVTTITIVAEPINGGAACPSPLVTTTSCATDACPQPCAGPGNPCNCGEFAGDPCCSSGNGWTTDRC